MCIVSSLFIAAQKSVENLKNAIVNVEHVGFANKNELISFEITKNDGINNEVVGKYVGKLAGRNFNLCIGFGAASDKAIAARVLIDGDAEKVE